MNITKNFTREELNPHNFKLSLKQTINLEHLAYYTLQPLRDYINTPIIINSGFRSIEYNRKIGGVADSQHTKGEAVDINVKNPKLLVKIFNEIDIIPKLTYDQIIIYYKENNSIPLWIHISHHDEYNRKEKLKCFIKKNGKKEYTVIEN